MLTEIAEVYEEVCSEWEINFVDSLLDWDGDFTEKQKAVLEKIYDKVCESPY
jgi:hypothetical protein